MEEVDLLTTIKHGQKQAEMYLFQGNLTQAFYAIQSVLEIAPPSEETLKILGNIQQKQGCLIEAKNSYLQAIQLNPDFASAYANLGTIYALEKNWDEAIQYYQQALQLEPNLVGVYRNLAKIWQHLGNDSEFYKCRYHIIMADNNTPYYDYVQLGHKLLKIGEKDQAINCYKRALEIHPQHFIALAILGDLSTQDGDFEKALHYYEQSLVTHTNPAIVYIKIGNLYFQKANLNNALFYYVESLKYKTDSLESYKKIKQILMKQGKLTNYLINNNFDFPGSLISDFLSLPENWSVSIASVPEISHEMVYAHSTIDDVKPSYTIANSSSTLECKKIDCPDVFISTIPHGIVWIDYMNLIFQTQKSQIIPEISVGFPELIASLPSSPINFYAGKTVILSCRWQSNYFHWMIDIIARIHLLLAKGLSLLEIDYFVVNNIDQPYCQETLEILGIDLDKIICSGSFAHLQSECLIVPSYPFVNGSRISKWVCEFLRSLFIPRINPNFISPKRIYISRSRSQTRRILNEDQVLSLLEKKDFVTIFLESMSILEQASYFANANIVVATHGAGLTNLVFAQPGTQVIELFPKYFVSELYWQICQICHLRHYHLVQERSILNELEIDNQDFYVNINDLSNILQVAGID